MTPGGAFLAGPAAPGGVYTPEDLTPDARLMGDTMEAFVRTDVLPRAAALEAREPGLMRRLLRDAAPLGLLAGGIPLPYGGLGLSRAALARLYERAALVPAFALAQNVHSGVASLPLAWFGTDAQCAHYLPAMASGEMIGAFALTEANAGSDALAARCRAIQTPEGYRLAGTKAWITNAGIADLFTVFARLEGAGLTAFLVPRDAPGVSLGREEEKLGLRGASTCALYLDNVPVPSDALLGEPGRGHRVALHPLNIGRLNIAASALGAAKASLLHAARHATARRQFGRPLAEMGLIQHKLGEMTARLFAAESMVYRIAGLLDAEMERTPALPPPAAEEYAIECALGKVYATETLAYVVDESLQIHGGYGFSEAYPAARAYRDARVMRLFEGTSEICRLTVADQLARRLRAGRIGFGAENGVAATSDPVAALRLVTGTALRAVWERFPDCGDAQEAATACADMIRALFAAESATLRAARLPGAARSLAEDAANIVLSASCCQVRDLAGRICRHLDDCALWSRFSALTPEPWLDPIAARRRLADALRGTDCWPWDGAHPTPKEDP